MLGAAVAGLPRERMVQVVAGLAGYCLRPSGGGVYHMRCSSELGFAVHCWWAWLWIEAANIVMDVLGVAWSGTVFCL